MAAISQVRKNHVEAVNSTDVEFALQDMSDSLVYLAHGLPPIEGKQALRDFITPIYETSSIEIEMIAKDIMIVDNTAIEWGIINDHFGTTTSDSITPVHNKYLLIYQKNEQGKWLITRDIYITK